MARAKGRHDRGDYRSFYVSFWDDLDLHALSDRAYRVLTTLKGILPATGIGIVYDLELCQRCGCTPKQLEKAYQELAAPKEDEPLGWIVRERNVVWIVNALRYEPNLSPENVSKHRPFVDRLVKQLGEKRPIVAQFRAHYPEWFPDSSETVPQPSPNPTDRVSKHRDGNRDRDRESDADRACAREASPPPDPDPLGVEPQPAPPAPRVQLPPNAVKLLERYFDPLHATEQRRTDVTRQLYDAIDPQQRKGARIERGRWVKARSVEHLDECCAAVLEDPPRDTALAVRFVLLKLADPPKGPSPTEIAAAEERQRVALEEQYQRAAKAAGAQWAKAHPDEWAKVRKPIDAEFGDGRGTFASMAKDAALVQAASHAAGFPSFDAWLPQHREHAA